MKTKLKNPIVQQYVLEIALPLIGYFFFDWSIAVIIVFYFMDYLASEISRHRRHFKIFKNSKTENKSLFFIGVGTSLMFYVVSLCWAIFNCVLLSKGQKVNHISEMEVFFKEEGWFLLPVVYLAYHFKDVMTFYMPRRFLNFDFKSTIRFFLVEISIMFVLIMTGIYCWAQFTIPEVPALCAFIYILLYTYEL